MTDRGILKDLWNNGYAQHAEKPQVNDAMNCDVDYALEKLRAYYREKIKRVGIEDIIREHSYNQCDYSVLWKECSRAILKAIDSEIKI